MTISCVYEFGQLRMKAHFVAALGCGDQVDVVGTGKIELKRRRWEESRNR